MDDINLMSAALLRVESQKKNIGVEEATRAYLERIEKYDQPSGLNTVAEINEAAIEQARRLDSAKTGQDSLLFGLPILVKDNIDVQGLHTTAGSLALSDNIARNNAPVIENAVRNGAVILGKTNMTEFANYTSQSMPNGFSSRGGFVRSAYDREKDPSGSSTGSAVAVSACFCSMAIGTDTSFSIVGCATVNGVTGLKPPVGTLPAKGIVPISTTLDSAGALAHDLADAILLYSGMSEKPIEPVQSKSPKQLRIAVNTFNHDKVSANQLSKYEDLFKELRSDGAKIEQIVQPYSPYQRAVMQCEFKLELESYLAASAAKRKSLKDIIKFYEAEPDKRMPYGISMLTAAEGSCAEDAIYQEAIRQRNVMRDQVQRELENYDVCVMTGPTNIMHFVGLPSLALELGMGEDGMPRGIIMYGANERRLLSAALTIEKYCLPVTAPKL